jgi:outer membrane receptor protein involved in Fe transport
LKLFKFVPLVSLFCCTVLSAQTTLHGHVVDRTGRVVPGVSIASGDQATTAVSDANGAFTLEVKANASGNILLRAQGASMDSGPLTIPASNISSDLQIVMAPAVLRQEATVTATRSQIEMGPNALTQSSLSGEQLVRFPALTVDESLRQHAGFELFRRSSGWIQNPTSQGVSLRGLGSTAVSRTLILTNSAPLNDPFGGWIHWDELPPETIEAVTITSGGGSDLYGSSAVGGVIDLVPAHPHQPRLNFSTSAAGLDTRTASGRGDLQQGRWSELLAGQDFRTAGYILTAPASRGPVDVPANAHFQNGRTEIDRTVGNSGLLFLTGNVLNENRNNGTPKTINSTRLWRYLAGDDWTAGSRATGRVRLFGSDESYSQTFTSINATRTIETLTRLQKVETQELGASTDASYHLSHLAFVGGLDVRDIRASDREKPAGALQATSSRQRFVGGFGEVVGEYGKWSGAASIRVDSARNLDTNVFTGPVLVSTPNRSEVVASPRVGIVRQITHQVSVHGSGYRAFRTPTMNELYRTFQVGSTTTQANPDLVSERATGAEGGINVHLPRLSAQASYFWIEINRPVASPQIASTPTTITLKRVNLGQVQSQGIDTSVTVNEGRALSATIGYQYAHSVVTKFSVDPTLIGKWLPDVPRESATAQIRYQKANIGDFVLSARNSGRAFDDSANTFILHSFFQLDAYGSRSIGRGFTAFVSAQNLTNRRAEVSRTPLLTQGIPFIAQGGIKYDWGGRHL